MKKDESKTEIIKCRHGKIFAACVVGYQDDEWNRNKSKYEGTGCKTEIVLSKGVRLQSCDCDPNKKPDIQINLF